MSTSGTVRLRRFYGARARRLLPASAIVGVVTAIGSAVLLPPLQARSVMGDGVASALYVSNYRFILDGVDYLAADLPPSPFQHYWSLGVEEQFYLVWPALIIGTAWLIRSKAKVIVAHSAFEPSGQDPARTRLLGVTWWRSHEANDEHYGGRAVFAGEATAGKPINPFEDDEADEVAQRLGFQPRNPENLNELGTSFLIVDPLVDPSELLDQLAIWWWPALEDHMFDVEVVTPDGPMTPRPAMLPVVAQFLTPYRIAKREQEPQDPNREQYASSRRRNTNGAGGSDLGGLGLVVADDPIGMDGEPAEGTAVVALALRTLGVTSDRLPGHSLALTTAGRADSMPWVIVSKSPGEVRRWFRSDGPSRATSTRPLAASLPVNSRQTRPAR